MAEIQFAVVGHPNKGKSSIVSTLSRNDDIDISPRSGTTTVTAAYDVKIMNSGYTLIDTPGFQRPRQVLRWLQERAGNASQRQDAVREFIRDPDTKRAFPDEIALLEPIMAGAAIIYVVDGSHPYGPEYEAEMDILRWCGQPRLALINPIQNSSHVTEWHTALDQYFSLVQTFNPMSASVEQQAQLLKHFTVIAPDWESKLNHLAEALLIEQAQWRQQAAEVMAHWLDEACQYQVKQKVLEKSQAEAALPAMETAFKHWHLEREQAALNQLKHIYRHMHTRMSIAALELPPDLFDIEQWYLWGLNKQQLLAAGTMGGIAAGGSIDMALGGASAMTGAVIGGLTGFASVMLGSAQLMKQDLKGLPLGGYEVHLGPIKDPNFPYVLINRFLHLHRQLAVKNHANRQEITQDIPSWSLTLEQLSDTMRKRLRSLCNRLTRQKIVDISELTSVLDQLLQQTQNDESIS